MSLEESLRRLEELNGRVSLDVYEFARRVLKMAHESDATLGPAEVSFMCVYKPWVDIVWPGALSDSPEVPFLCVVGHDENGVVRATTNRASLFERM